MPKYTFIHEPGHGWLKVPLAEIEALGIGEQITAFSFRDNEFAYLEEDQDMGIFWEAKREIGETLSEADLEREYVDYFSRNRPSFWE